MANHGGARPNAGRKKGRLNKKTLEQQAINEAFNQRVMMSADKLFEAQLSLAVGSSQVYRVDIEEDENGKQKRVHVLVTDPDEIKEVLDAEGGQVGESFYFINNVLPDNRAIDSMLNRGLGKPTDKHEIKGDIDAPMQVVVRYIKP